MNISELARQLKTTTQELKDVLPEFGFHIGQRAIKIDDVLAGKVMQEWPKIKRQLEARKAQEQTEEVKQVVSTDEAPVVLPEMISVGDFAKALELPVTTVITELMKSGILATINERIDFETAAIIAEDLGKVVTKKEGDDDSADEEQLTTLEDKLSKVATNKGKTRPPVIVILGHVDHGKTTLLDTIRQTSVAKGESGGITQHIGAYQIEKNGKAITFIDTPGHEAFTAMRSRGAKIADIAVLVVAADDSVKPQTIESIRMIESAKLPLIVAINKVDKEGANLEKVKSDLSQHKLITEEWGGKTPMVPLSALKGEGIDDLLEQLLLIADLENEHLLADPDGPVVTVVVESHVDPAEGVVATLLVKSGTLKQQDSLCLEDTVYGKARVMKDHTGKSLKKAPPSTPVRVTGFKMAPHVGDVIEVCSDKDKRKKLRVRMGKTQQDKMVSITAKSDETEQERNTLHLVIKADTLGSLEAIMQSLEKLPQQVVKLHVVHKGLGHITDSDLLRGQTSNALVLGFKVNMTPTAQELLQGNALVFPEGFDVKRYDVIYELFDEVRNRMEVLVTPEMIREDIGKLEVLALFRKVQGGHILGGKVTDGVITLEADKKTKVDILQGDVKMGEGVLVQLQAGKQDTKEVRLGQECGLRVDTQTPIEEGMILAFYNEREEKRSLEG